MTAAVDHYPADPRLEDYGLPASVQAYVDAGVRAALCIACQDQRRVVYEDEATFLAGLPADLAEPLRARLRPFDEDGFFADWERLAARFDGQDGRIRVGFGPGGPQWCSDGLLQRIRRVADEHDHAPVQIHLLESRFQALYGHRQYGHSVVRHLADVGFFGAATSCAHCVWVSHEDIEILAASGAVAIHNPSSNALLFNGVSPVADLLDGGARVGFGLDTAGLNETQDALTDLRLGLILQRRPGWDRRQVTPSDMLALATHGGAPALGMGVALGRLEPGYQADVVLVDRTRLYESPYVSPTAPAEDVLLRRASAADVEHVLVGGRLVVEGGRAVGIDETALAGRVARSLERAREMLPSADDFSERLQPSEAAFYRRWESESAALQPPNYLFNTR
jgi:5-methylthioadenosine/S-adenosylhomocysteine deaminase